MQSAGYALSDPSNSLALRNVRAPVRGGLDSRVEFVLEPLATPSLVRPDHESEVLYVRLTAPRTAGARLVSVHPAPGAAVTVALQDASGRGDHVRRAVVVGADVIFAELGAVGRDAAIAAFVDVVRALTDSGLPFVWRTRAGIEPGTLPPTLAHALAAAARLCTVELGVATVDDRDARALEGDNATSFDARLRLAGALVARGIGVRALVDPLVPMLTDQQGPLDALVDALAKAGVRKLGARYITLTRERAKVIAARLAGMQKALLQGVFADEPWQKADEDSGPRELHKRIPPALRRRGHERLIEVGAHHGVVVEILDPVDDDELARSITRALAPGPQDRLAKPVRLRPQLDLFATQKKPR